MEKHTFWQEHDKIVEDNTRLPEAEDYDVYLEYLSWFKNEYNGHPVDDTYHSVAFIVDSLAIRRDFYEMGGDKDRFKIMTFEEYKKSKINQ